MLFKAVSLNTNIGMGEGSTHDAPAAKRSKLDEDATLVRDVCPAPRSAEPGRLPALTGQGRLVEPMSQSLSVNEAGEGVRGE